MPSTQSPEATQANPASAYGREQKRARRKQRNPRNPTSCEPCRISKLRCDRQLPCGACSRRDNASQCRYSGNSRKSAVPQNATTGPPSEPHGSQPALPINTDKNTRIADISGLTNPHVSSDGEDYTRASWDALWQRPAHGRGKLITPPTTSNPFSMTSSNRSAEELASLLPPAEHCDFLIIQYFTYIAPMFHVVHEQSFQHSYTSFDRNSQSIDLSWLALIFSILSLAIQTLEDKDFILEKVKQRIGCDGTTSALAKGFRQLAINCLCADNFMFHFTLVTLESLLLLTYGICHDSGVDAAWTLLGMALNMGIALKCNASDVRQETDADRRRRCWIGILSLHTYQAMLFRDVDLKQLLKTLPRQSVAIIGQNTAAETPGSPAGALIMDMKIELFKLASQICSKDVIEVITQGDALDTLDAELSNLRELWSTHFLDAGVPSVLDATRYAHWCMFEMYTHQLCLHLHRPFCRARSTGHTTPYRPASKRKCLASGAALLDFNQRYLESPRLRHYRWSMFGWNATCTVHGALALASCLLDDEDGVDLMSYRLVFDVAVNRLGLLQHQSSIYLKAYPFLRHIQAILSTKQSNCLTTTNVDFGASFDNWMDTIELFDPTCIDWSYWDDIVINEAHAS